MCLWLQRFRTWLTNLASLQNKSSPFGIRLPSTSQNLKWVFRKMNGYRHLRVWIKSRVRRRSPTSSECSMVKSRSMIMLTRTSPFTRDCTLKKWKTWSLLRVMKWRRSISWLAVWTLCLSLKFVSSNQRICRLLVKHHLRWLLQLEAGISWELIHWVPISLHQVQLITSKEMTMTSSSTWALFSFGNLTLKLYQTSLTKSLALLNDRKQKCQVLNL